MKHLKEAQKLIEVLISKTPTSDLRNDLTDINILLSTGINEVKEFCDEINKVVTKER